MSAPVFDAALRGAPTFLVGSDGRVAGLAVHRLRRPADGDDAWLLDRCAGPVVDLGCGPGRLLVALAERGIPALGVDHSPVAQAHCRRRRVAMVRRDLFAALPEEGRWWHVLLADGNIGIGGDPASLLTRAARLLRPGGTLLVETHPEPERAWSGTVRVCSAGRLGPAVPWAAVGSAALRRLGRSLGLREGPGRDGRRCFVELTAG
ncbi:class I SAM-dependent methyltransferase [Pseudonocardia xinjiangensis]|uniref:Class I SAM-dependent methyltransferase n=1 Tax=Pseudonocardia xinjiangensis TaxID=75289 RepID=A0ABX1RCE6_9PSEU|nr:methyltransferase domain-containing protein [Pseudonocardia xinjiangensis]NMH76826.1 class I SAM-dependent methyltransferase [Pseudonocardia xinjiangensis]